MSCATLATSLQLHNREVVFLSSLGQLFVCCGLGISKEVRYERWGLEVAAQLGSISVKATKK